MITCLDDRTCQNLPVREVMQSAIGKGLRSRYPLEELIPDGLLALLTQLKGPDQQPQSKAES